MGLGIISILIVVFILLVGLVITLINPDHTDYREELYNADDSDSDSHQHTAKKRRSQKEQFQIARFFAKENPFKQGY